MNHVPSEPDDVLYNAVAARRTTTDGMMWQAPFLSLTAQAFLFTIALGKDSELVARLISSGLALLSALACLHLMAKHRYYERLDSEWLKLYEDRFYEGVANGKKLPCKVHARRDSEFTKIFPGDKWLHRPITWLVTRSPIRSSYVVWMIALLAFALGACAAGLIAVIWPELLSGTASQ
jgi:hypothetical protein